MWLGLVLWLLMVAFSHANTEAEPAKLLSIAEIGQLHENVELLYRQGKYADALIIAKRVLNACENSLGPEHPETGTSLNNLAELYHAMGAYDKALPLYQRALAISRLAHRNYWP